jgi:3-oxoadipate enol-lactonase
MRRIRSNDAEIAYEVLGDGAPVVLLHPFPAHHGIWLPAAQRLAQRYRVILPDLRGHGESETGDGPATMEKHAADLARICQHEDVGRAVFVGSSIGGYILFECWRQFRGRIAALVLCNTKAQADTAEGRATRLAVAEDVLRRGTTPFLEDALPKLIGATTRTNRPDLVEDARQMMQAMSPEGVASVQRGMAARPDSIATAKTITVPTLLIAGDEDVTTPVADLKLLRQQIQGAQLRVVPQAGHYAVFEQSAAVGLLLRQFCELSG